MTAVAEMTRRLLVKINTGSGLVEYNTAVTSVTETPTRQTATTTVASGESVTDVGPTSWSIDVAYNASWSADSLHRVLLENDGTEATLEWEPDPDGASGLKRTATVVLVAPSGAAVVGQFKTGQVSLPVRGDITTTDPA